MLLNYHTDEPFKSMTVAKSLKKHKAIWSQLSYNSMRLHLEAKNVITENERKEIDAITINAKQMEMVIDIVHTSLLLRNAKKYKGFIEAIEQSDDDSVKDTASKLQPGKWINISIVLIIVFQLLFVSIFLLFCFNFNCFNCFKTNISFLFDNNSEQ